MERFASRDSRTLEEKQDDEYLLENPRSQYSINKAMLTGKQPESYLIEQGANLPSNSMKKILTSQDIIQTNIICFDKVLNDRLDPYRWIVDGMKAMKTEKHTQVVDDVRFDSQGKPHKIKKYVHLYREVPDHAARLPFIRIYMFMTGNDPRTAEKIKITAANGTSVEFSAALLHVLKDSTSDEDAEKRLRELQDAERRGNIIEGKFNEVSEFDYANQRK